MRVVRLAEAPPYVAPLHDATIHSLHLMHQRLGSTAPFWVGLSYYLPGARAEMSASPLERVYVVLDGQLTVELEGETVTLGRLDTIWIEPNERREARNDTNEVVTMLVVMPYPPAS